ncbi:MAG: FadR family transcriptional regulator [Defluviitaleaceae bacterium]|nr:FadR family transcriptional regulator [Defluviitaleaceae bacterium]
MEIKPVVHSKVGEQVYDQMKEMLFSGTWTQGEKIPSENVLATQFGVSRVTVRQAIQRLGALGLLETRFGEGSFVKTVNLDEGMNSLIPLVYLEWSAMEELFEFREIIEVESVILATKYGTEESIAELEDILNEMIMYEKKSDMAALAKSDVSFHYKIAEMTKNRFLIKTMSILKDVFENAIWETTYEVAIKTGVDSIYYHQEILKGIKAQNPEKASKVMHEHIWKTRELFKKIRKE